MIYGLWRAKEFADLVGGKTKILTIDDANPVVILDEENDPVLEAPSAHLWTDAQVQDVEKDYKHLDEEMRQLFVNFPQIGPSELPRQFRAVGIELKRYRTDRRKEIAKRKI